MLKINISISFIIIIIITPIATASSNPVLVPIINYLVSSDTPIETEFPIPNINDTQKQEFLTAINNARSHAQDCGRYGIKSSVDPLTWSDKLYKVAYVHNYDMAYSGVFSHTGSGTEFDIVAMNIDGISTSTMTDRIRYYEYRYSTIGENIAAGYSSIESVITGWLNSDGHCDNIMDADFTQVGMALLYNEHSNYRYYWTQNFGKPYE